MNKKIYYIFFIMFVFISGVWYSLNYEDLMKRHTEAERISVSAEVKDADESKNIPYIININKADIYELTALEGIGDKKAKSIIEYREKHGRYKSSEELLNVNGIGEALLEKIKDKITVEE